MSRRKRREGNGEGARDATDDQSDLPGLGADERDAGDAAGPDHPHVEFEMVGGSGGGAESAAGESEPGSAVEPEPGAVRPKGSGGAPAVPPPSGGKLAAARELVRAGRVEEALAAYRAVLHEDAANLKARNNLGVLLDEMGSHELALEQFEAALGLEPENVEVLTNLGTVLGALGRYDEAERELRRAQRIEPESVAVRASLGILLFRRGLYGQAEGELRWVCGRDADHGAAHFYRGEALNRLGRWEEALEVLERAIHLQPRNARAHYTMGILYDRKHLSAEAQAMYRKARELSHP